MRQLLLSPLFYLFFLPYSLVAQGDLPTNAQPGKCYTKCLIPDQYESISEQVLLKEAATRIEVIPAVYDTIEEQVLEKEAYTVFTLTPAVFETASQELLTKEASSRWTYQAPVFETVSEQILTKPAATKWTKSQATHCTSTNQEDCKVWCLTETPADYQTITRQALQKPASVEEIPVPAEYKTITKAIVKTPAQLTETTIPAVYRTVQKVVVKTPATTQVVEIPAEYSTVTTRKLVRQGGFTDWVEVLCEAKITSSRISEIQQSLKAKGYDVGAVDNVLGAKTKQALVQYQRDNGLPVGNMNIETMRSLGTSGIPSAMIGKPHSPSEYSSTGSPATYMPSIVPRPSNAGILTAGEINDFNKWKLWSDMTFEELHRWENYWKFKPKHRYVLQLTTSKGYPIADYQVELLDDQKNTVWTSKTDNTGKAELWIDLFNHSKETVEKYQIKTTYKNKVFSVKHALPFQKGINFLQLPSECQKLSKLDLMFVVDATGSMGDEIRHLKAELQDVVAQIQNEHSSLQINLGSVFYRDEGDEYVTRQSPLSNDISQTIQFIQKQHANGGGDTPEAVHSALQKAIENAEWSPKNASRLLFLVLDASPHHRPEIIQQLQKSIQLASNKGIRIIPVASSGIAKDTEYLMRSFALATNGIYTFLTDHSGVGNTHLKPSTDDYDMEFLNDLLVRIINQSLHIPSCETELEVPITNSKTALSFIEKGETKTSASKLTELQLFPNPVDKLLNIDLSTSIDELFLTDFTGKILLKLENTSKGKHQIAVEQFPSGIYFLKYQNGENSNSKQFIINH